MIASQHASTQYATASYPMIKRTQRTFITTFLTLLTMDLHYMTIVISPVSRYKLAGLNFQNHLENRTEILTGCYRDPDMMRKILDGSSLAM